MADINAILTDVTKIEADRLTDDLRLAEVKGWDSLKHMNLIISLESACGIMFDMSEIVSMDTIGSIKNILRSKGVAV